MSTENRKLVVIATSLPEESNGVANAIQGPQIDEKPTCPQGGLPGLLKSLGSTFSETQMLILSTDIFDDIGINIVSVLQAVRKNFPNLFIFVFRNEYDDDTIKSEILKVAGANFVTKLEIGEEKRFRATVYKQLDLVEAEIVTAETKVTEPIDNTPETEIVAEDSQEETSDVDTSSEEAGSVTDFVDEEKLPEQPDTNETSDTTAETGTDDTHLINSDVEVDTTATLAKTLVPGDVTEVCGTDIGVEQTVAEESDVQDELQASLKPEEDIIGSEACGCTANLPTNNSGLSNEVLLALVRLAKIGIQQIEDNLLQRTVTANSANNSSGDMSNNIVTKSDVTEQQVLESSKPDDVIPKLARVQISRTKYKVTINGHKVILTKYQLDVLDILVAENGKYIFATDIAKKLGDVKPASINQRIYALRRVMNAVHTGLGDCIDSSSGRGNRFVAND
ncbi:MAG: hypothetical protein H6779_02950 [Candidatus Nomurabacteria bacterium]|nr:hypothetical protein [Candidatus Nomurabacteria bacterium]USN87348.1 MAG: hypothetical protein H6779_02950 [Candidatus Nomurabacteria bacterium]